MSSTIVDLTSKVVVITGAASGIGLAAADTFAREGARLGLVDRDEERLAKAAAELRAHDAVSVETAVADLATAEGVRDSIGALLAAYGRIDVLVNNAGVLRVKPFDQATDADWQEAFDVHVMAAVRACRLVLPGMRARGEGCVLFVVSDLAHHPVGVAPHYQLSKTALLSLIADLAMEEGPQGIRVNGVAPGPTDTPMLGPLKAGLSRASGLPPGEALRQELVRRRQALQGRVIQPEEVADALVYLATREAITGAVLPVDGGTYGGLP
jgi:NAD(P)-dependent dehydrogenase (short-subunit alcohol dehydrogenase family)